MSKRDSGRARRRLDLYETPAWVVAEGLAPHFEIKGETICDPCCGHGAIVRVLENLGARVVAADVKLYHGMKSLLAQFQKQDFLAAPSAHAKGYVLNPPYGKRGLLAEDFIAHVCRILRVDSPAGAWAAVLLPADFDMAVTRSHLFEDNPLFVATIRLRRRIAWFKPKKGGSGPSENHAWFIFRKAPRPRGLPPVTLYAPNRNGAAPISIAKLWEET